MFATSCFAAGAVSDTTCESVAEWLVAVGVTAAVSTATAEEFPPADEGEGTDSPQDLIATTRPTNPRATRTHTPNFGVLTGELGTETGEAFDEG